MSQLRLFFSSLSLISFFESKRYFLVISILNILIAPQAHAWGYRAYQSGPVTVETYNTAWMAPDGARNPIFYGYNHTIKRERALKAETQSMWSQPVTTINLLAGGCGNVNWSPPLPNLSGWEGSYEGIVPLGPVVVTASPSVGLYVQAGCTLGGNGSWSVYGEAGASVGLELAAGVNLIVSKPRVGVGFTLGANARVSLGRGGQWGNLPENRKWVYTPSGWTILPDYVNVTFTPYASTHVFGKADLFEVVELKGTVNLGTLYAPISQELGIRFNHDFSKFRMYHHAKASVNLDLIGGDITKTVKLAGIPVLTLPLLTVPYQIRLEQPVFEHMYKETAAWQERPVIW